MIVYRYVAADRTHRHPKGKAEDSFALEPPTLKLPAVPKSIKGGKHYVVIEAMFSSPVEGWGLLNWRAFVEAETGAVLYLRALTDGVTGLVFNVDPMTKTNNPANLPSAVSATLDPLRDNVMLVDLGVPTGSPLTQALSGSFVALADKTAPSPALPTTVSPFNFSYVSRTDNFAAVNAYYHCDRLLPHGPRSGLRTSPAISTTPRFRTGGSPRLGERDQRAVPWQFTGQRHRLRAVRACRPGSGPLGIACDWRVVIHEIGGHGILWDHVDSPNFGFAHSAGDSLAAILNDPDTQIPAPTASSRSRGSPSAAGTTVQSPAGDGAAATTTAATAANRSCDVSLPFVRSIGGDSTYPPRRLFASRSASYLILRGVGQLTPSTNPGGPLAWEQQLETADAGQWTSTSPAEVMLAARITK